MKRVKSACILQTLLFSQKPELGLSAEESKRLNYEELRRYKDSLDKAKTRYIIVDEAAQEDGSVLIHVKKQYNDSADVSEYF